MIMKPCTLKDAAKYIHLNHRHLKNPPPGHLFAMKAIDGDRIVGVVVVGRPVARHQQDSETAEINRLCTDGTKNVVSFLIGKAKRAARALGYKRMISYTLESEPGVSWRAGGMMQTGKTSGGKWTGTYGTGKPRKNEHPTCPKRRWEIAL